MKIIRRGAAGLTALVVFVMAFLPGFPVLQAQGAVAFGELEYSNELVALWDQLAAEEGLERTDMQNHYASTYPKPKNIASVRQQTGRSNSGTWKDWEYRNVYCISHSGEAANNPVSSMVCSSAWYAREPWTLQNLPDYMSAQSGGDDFRLRFNFLMLAYAADYKAYQGGVNSDSIVGTADYYLCQGICTLTEKAAFSGDYDADWALYQPVVMDWARHFKPNSQGSSKVYQEMAANVKNVFQTIWNTARLMAECTESSEQGFVYHPVIAQEADGLFHVRFPMAATVKPVLEAASIAPQGDWSFCFSENAVDFQSPTGEMPECGYLAVLNFSNANGVLARSIGEESVREFHQPVQVRGEWSITYSQANLVSSLKPGLQITIGTESVPGTGGSSGGDGEVVRYRHSETWQADYVVHLRKYDAETGKPLAGAQFDILEAFDDSQLDGSILEDDNWENDGGSQFLRWDGWDPPYEERGDEPCTKDQEITDEDGWLVEMASSGAGPLHGTGVRAHRDTKYYAYTKGYCGGHPEPESDGDEEEDDEAMEAYERELEICEQLAAEGGFFHSLEGGADQLKEDRDRHYQEFVSLTYDYSARELTARDGYTLHNQDQVHDPFENIYDGIHNDTVPVETVTVHSSQYYELGAGRAAGGAPVDSEMSAAGGPDLAATEDLTIRPFSARMLRATSSDWEKIPDEDIKNEEIKNGEIKNEEIVDEDLAEENFDDQDLTATPSNGVRKLPGQVRTAENHKYGNEAEFSAHNRDSETERGTADRGGSWAESFIAPVPKADDNYGGDGADWVFELYDHRTEGQVHINKRDLALKRGEGESYDSYGDTQGDGTLEGAVYGLFAAEDLIHPDGKTGVVYQKGNLVSVAATDWNGDASFMVCTEKPGVIYDYDQGTIVPTGFTGPENLYTKQYEQYTSNESDWQGSRWHYPIFNNEEQNGNCWIGRPLLMGSYYVQELTRSEGYELSVFGIEAAVTNRDAWQAEAHPGTGTGNVALEDMEEQVLVDETTGSTGTVTQLTLVSEGTVNGYDLLIRGIDPASGPSFYLTERGQQQVFVQWEEPVIVMEPVNAEPGTPVIIRGQPVEAEKGDRIQLPSGETVEIQDAKQVPVTGEIIVVTGPKKVIPTFDRNYIPELTDISAESLETEEAWIQACNQAMEAIGLEAVGEGDPYILIELPEDKTRWTEALYDYFSAETCPSWNCARLETISRQQGKNMAVLRVSFRKQGEVCPVVYSAGDQTFYVMYELSGQNSGVSYLYRGYPAADFSEDQIGVGNRLYSWIRIPNEKPARNQPVLYEDLSALEFVSAQEMKSCWVYAPGEFFRNQDGSIYQKEVVHYETKSDWHLEEVYEETPFEAVYDEDRRAWILHIAPEMIPADGRRMISIRYADIFAGNRYGLSVTAVPSSQTAGTYVRPVILSYPGQYQTWEDGGTRNRPVEVEERAISQQIKVKKTLEQENLPYLPNFRFKTYLKSNLQRLFRDENGAIVWQDRWGGEQTDLQVIEENQTYPERARKLYTKVLHETDPLRRNSQEAVIANEQLYGFDQEGIRSQQNPGYMAVLERDESQEYQYEKFFDAIAVANHDKWDDGAPSYTSWHPIGNRPNRTESTLENARRSDHVRQFAIDWYLDYEIRKLVKSTAANAEEKEVLDGETVYTDELYDEALYLAILKAENYLKPFFAYDLDEIYAIAWDSETEGGKDRDQTTLSADTLSAAEQNPEEGCYAGISAYLPYGIYLVVEQQPGYAQLEDFVNRHYQIDKPKEVILPAVYAGSTGALVIPDYNPYYHYAADLDLQEQERRYKIRFREENRVIQAHSHQGDFQVYQYGMDIDRISNGTGDVENGYFALTQSPYRPNKNHYNETGNRLRAPVDYYLAQGQSGREKVGADYRYSSVSEQRGVTETEKRAAMTGSLRAVDGQYAPMLVPWTVVEPGGAEAEAEAGNPLPGGESSFRGFDYVRFKNRPYETRLRLEKLDGDTHEKILHDGAIFNLYQAERVEDADGDGTVLFYEKPTVITGTLEFLEAMKAEHIQPMAKYSRSALLEQLKRLLNWQPEEYGPGSLYTGVVPEGTPVCRETKRVVIGDAASFTTVLETEMEDPEGGRGRNRQTVGYLKTPEPVPAGVYVLAEVKAPEGYTRTAPMAIEVYSDQVTYYKEGQRDSRILAAKYDHGREDSGQNLARVYVENEPISLQVEKIKESSQNHSTATPDKTITYRVSGPLEYLKARQEAGEQVELVYHGKEFAGYGYVTRTLETADDGNPYAAGAVMTLFDALELKRSGDRQDHAYQGLVVERNTVNDVTRMYVQQGFAGEKTVMKEHETEGKTLLMAAKEPRPDTDILYYDLGSLVLSGPSRDPEPVVTAYRSGRPYLELAGGDVSKISYNRKDKNFTVGKDTKIYHLDRDGNRDALVDPYTGMAYAEDGEKRILVWPVHIRKDIHGNIIARDKITTSRIATVGEYTGTGKEQETLDVINHSGQEIPVQDRPSYEHEESGYTTGSWSSEAGEASHHEVSRKTNDFGQNLNEEVLSDENNGSFGKSMNPVYDEHGLAVYYQNSGETYEKGTDVYDRNGDFVRHQDSDNLDAYNQAAYRIDESKALHDAEETQEAPRRRKLYHRQGEAYILENTWISSEQSPNDPFCDQMTDGQADLLKRIPAGTYILEELKPPAGYGKSLPAGIKVEETNQIQRVQMTDQTTKVEIAKIDGVCLEDGRSVYSYECVPDAVLAVYEAEKVYTADTGQYPKGYYLKKKTGQSLTFFTTDSSVSSPHSQVARWTTGELPNYLEGIPEGCYLVEEEKTPSGFVTAEPTELEVNGSGKVACVTVYNDHTKVEIEKYAGDRLLAGAGFTLYPAILDPSGNVVLEDGKPRYDEKYPVDTWITEDVESYRDFIPAFEAMYQNYGCRPGTRVRWESTDGQHQAEFVSAKSAEEGTWYPASVVLLFQTETGKMIRITIRKDQQNFYQFDYRKLEPVNGYAVSYLTLEGRRRLDYLPAGSRLVLVETTVPEGYAKAPDTVIEVENTAEIQNYRIENQEGRLVISKAAARQDGSFTGELAGAHMMLYRAGEGETLVMDAEHLVTDWITGSDGCYTEEDKINGRIPEGYQKGDLKPHEIRRLDSGVYWLVEYEAPDYYTLMEPFKIRYRQEEEIRLIRAVDLPVTGELILHKTDMEAKLLRGVTFELTAYRKTNLREPVKTWIFSDIEGTAKSEQLPVGEMDENGMIRPYLYRLKELSPPDGYAVGNEVLRWSFSPKPAAENQISYRFGEPAKQEFTVKNEKTRIAISKKDFDRFGDKTSEGFVEGAGLAIYEVTGRDGYDQLIFDESHPAAEWIAGATEGDHFVEGLIAGHTYLLKELQVPDGYHRMEPVLFTLSADGRRIAAVSDQTATVTLHGETYVEAVTIQGRYAVKTGYELSDDQGTLLASWSGGEGDYVIGREQAEKLGFTGKKSGTVTERTHYSDGSAVVSRVRTEVFRPDESGMIRIPIRKTPEVSLELAWEDGTPLKAFQPTETVSGITVANEISPEPLEITMQNRDGVSGDGLDSRKAVFCSMICRNMDHKTADLELTVDLGPEITVLDEGGGTVKDGEPDSEPNSEPNSEPDDKPDSGSETGGKQLVFRLEQMVPEESREVHFVTEVGGLSAYVTATLKQEGYTCTSVKEVPVMQDNKLLLFNEVTGSGSRQREEEESSFVIRLYRENGEEMKGSYACMGNRKEPWEIRSGEMISLKGNEWILLDPDSRKPVRYQAKRLEDGEEVSSRKTEGWIGGKKAGLADTDGACAVFSENVQDETLRKTFRKGETYILTETTSYGDGERRESGRLGIRLDETASVHQIAAADRQTKVVVSKTDITGSEELPGNEMSIRDLNGETVTSWISGDRPHEISGILQPKTTYILEEICPKPGYTYGEQIRFTVDETGAVSHVTMRNQRTEVRIRKIDRETGEPLAGALFEIRTMEGRVVDSWISGAEAYHEVTGILTAGETYLVCEVQAPEGYIAGEPVKFTMSKEAVEEPLIIIMENRREDIPEKPDEPEVPQEPDKPKNPGHTGGSGTPGKPEIKNPPIVPEFPFGNQKIGTISARYEPASPGEPAEADDETPGWWRWLPSAGDRRHAGLKAMIFFGSAVLLAVLLIRKRKNK